jgi:uncharacterized protein YrrD
MLRPIKSVEGFKLSSQDGEIGRIKEFYFDDQQWVVRYLVADTGTWLSGRQVLISPYSLKGFNDDDKTIKVDLTREQIEKSPSIESDKPVSRQYEIEYYKYYGWPMYWYGPAVWGPGPYPAYYGHGGGPVEEQPRKVDEEGDPHLRSTRALSGYHIRARDEEIGHVDDFILDDENWAIRYLVVDTRNWLPGKEVLIAPQWVQNISWQESSVSVDLARETIRQAPEYKPRHPITRDYEEKLFNYYSREKYWTAEHPAA